jgi:8-oxoguanine deaminase
MPPPMTGRDVVRIGTAGGARLLGLDGVGTIAVGQAADLAVYDLDQPRFFGLHDPAGRPGGQWRPAAPEGAAGARAAWWCRTMPSRAGPGATAQ